MKLSQMFAELAIETLEYLERLYQLVTCKPKPQLTLLALNVNWFTNCNWRDQLIAFKQIEDYRSNKH